MNINDYPCTFRPNEGPSDILKDHIDEILRTRHDHLEKYTAAFITQVGSAEASKYQLIEKREGLTTSWYFEKRDGA